MPLRAYISVKGNKQGQFKSESMRKNESIPILAFRMEVLSPLDSASGQATGKRQYKPVTIVKEWGAASPQGLTACTTNEVLDQVLIEFMKINPAGVEYIYQRVTLSQATIVDVTRYTHAQDGTLLLAPGSGETMELESWSFVFRRIEVDDTEGKTTFIDNWSATA
jgi:type VI secretion system secreted protein Hcp